MTTDATQTERSYKCRNILPSPRLPSSFRVSGLLTLPFGCLRDVRAGLRDGDSCKPAAFGFARGSRDRLAVQLAVVDAASPHLLLTFARRAVGEQGSAGGKGEPLEPGPITAAASKTRGPARDSAGSAFRRPRGTAFQRRQKPPATERGGPAQMTAGGAATGRLPFCAVTPRPCYRTRIFRSSVHAECAATSSSRPAPRVTSRRQTTPRSTRRTLSPATTIAVAESRDGTDAFSGYPSTTDCVFSYTRRVSMQALD
ncbi:hypothetical protein MRX96_005321 [Rhipicephalus microplus]